MNITRKEIIRTDCNFVVSDNNSFVSGLKNSKVLITGGTGFMGSWLTELIAFLNDIHGFNTQLTLVSDRASDFKNRAPHLEIRPDITLIERDIRYLTEIPSEINWIIHAAGSPDNRIHASDPLKTIDVIVNGTRSILECATRLPDLKKFMNISSGLIYGTQPMSLNNISEECVGNLDCGSFRAAYPEAKRTAEVICAAYRNQHRLPINNVRPFAFIGPYQLLDRPWAINNFIRDSLLGGPIRILGDGESVRSYMYPSDMAWWLLNILTRGESGTNYNLGSPNDITLLKLAEMIAHQFPQPPKIVSRVSLEKIIAHSRFVPDVTFAEKNLGLVLKVDLETAIKRTILWNQIL